MNDIELRPSTDARDYGLDLGESIIYLLYRINNSLARDFSEALGHDNISIQQWRVLSSLKSRNGKSTISELSACTIMKQTIISRIISEMQENELVQKAQRRDDLRITEVTLTPKGSELFASILPLAVRHRERALAYLNKKEVDQLRKTLKQIQFNLGIKTFSR